MEVIGLTRACVYKDENRTKKLLESFQSILNDLMGVPIQKPGFSSTLCTKNITVKLDFESNKKIYDISTSTIWSSGGIELFI